MEKEHWTPETVPQEGTRVVALIEITESGDLPGDPNADFPAPTYIHARAGEFGVVGGVDFDDTVPTVWFERTGTATIVSFQEIEVCD